MDEIIVHAQGLRKLFHNIVKAVMQGTKAEITQEMKLDDTLLNTIQSTNASNIFINVQNAQINSGVPSLIFSALEKLQALEDLARKQRYIETGGVAESVSLEYAVQCELLAGESLKSIKERVDQICYDYALLVHHDNRAEASRMLGMSRTSVVNYALKAEKGEI